MGEKKIMDYEGIQTRIEGVSFAVAEARLAELMYVDSLILDLQEQLAASDLSGFSYESQRDNFQKGIMGLSSLSQYVYDAKTAFEEFDENFRNEVSKGAVEDLSLVKMEDIRVENHLGVNHPGVEGGYQTKVMLYRQKEYLTLGDFIGSKDGTGNTYVEEFQKLFADGYRETGELTLPQYLETLTQMGEYDHKKYQPIKQVVSEVLDILTIGVKPLLESIIQYDIILGEDLSDTECLFKAVEGIVSLTTFGLGVAGKGAGSILAAYISQAGGDLAAEGIITVGEAIDLPPLVTALLALAGGSYAGGKLNKSEFAEKLRNLRKSNGCEATVNALEGASGAVKNIDPSEIRFSQTSVNGSQEIIDSMKKNGWKGDPIDVVEMPDGKITTIDNTRVSAAKEAGIDVKATVRKYSDPLPDDMIARFTTPKGTPKTWGEALELRIQKQKASFRNNNPMGSYDLEKMK